MIKRVPEGRTSAQLRPLKIEIQANSFAEGAVVISTGCTQVLCTASVEESVPGWLVGKGKGWVTAEYSMLPRSTHTRTKRDREKISGRTQEIQRLIGRALRSVVDLKALGERSILVDCDVLQADGGTRTASITGGCVALGLALEKLYGEGKIGKGVLQDTVAAVSVGIKNGIILVDMDYPEDSSCDVDMNFVVTGQGGFVEVQGTGEHRTFSKSDLDEMSRFALTALGELKEAQRKVLGHS